MTMVNENFDLYADEHAPAAAHQAVVYTLGVNSEHKQPHPGRVITVYVAVDNYGMCHLEHNGFWLGEKVDPTNHTLAREIYDWLVEWEYAEWKAIGPEDHELFATEKLTSLQPSL
jgi:hypothetical protein